MVTATAQEEPYDRLVSRFGVVFLTIDLPPPDPEAPGPFRYADADKLLTLLDRAGYGELQQRAKAANFALASFSSFGELLAEALTVRFPGINWTVQSGWMRAFTSSPARG